MNKHTSLYDFGYNFLGPICSEYFRALIQRCEDVDPDRLLFLAREGYFFERAYKMLVKKGFVAEIPSTYLYVSRTFLFRICIGDKSSWLSSLSHSFYGSLQKLLVGRFGFSVSQVKKVFTESELQTLWLLPFEEQQLEILFNTHIDKLNDAVKATRMAYFDYLRSEDIHLSEKPLMVDVGYAGTIQKLLTGLLQTDTEGLYFIATREGSYSVNGCVAQMKSVFKEGVKMGEGYTMLDRSLFLESLLTAPNGQFIDIAKKSEYSEQSFEFFFGRNTYTQRNFHELNTVFKGAEDAISDNFQNNVHYSTEEIEVMYDQYAHTRNMFPRASWPLFDVDDAISGNANVDPLKLFRL